MTELYIANLYLTPYIVQRELYDILIHGNVSPKVVCAGIPKEYIDLFRRKHMGQNLPIFLDGGAFPDATWQSSGRFTHLFVCQTILTEARNTHWTFVISLLEGAKNG